MFLSLTKINLCTFLDTFSSSSALHTVIFCNCILFILLDKIHIGRIETIHTGRIETIHTGASKQFIWAASKQFIWAASKQFIYTHVHESLYSMIQKDGLNFVSL